MDASKLYDEGRKFHSDFQANDRTLLQILQTCNCHDVVSAATSGDDLALCFTKAGSENNVDLLEAFCSNGVRPQKVTPH